METKWPNMLSCYDPVGVWHHIMLTFSLTDGPTLYINGAQPVYTMTTSAGHGKSDFEDFVIGKHQSHQVVQQTAFS